jgi:hypothetical protein
MGQAYTSDYNVISWDVKGSFWVGCGGGTQRVPGRPENLSVWPLFATFVVYSGQTERSLEGDTPSKPLTHPESQRAGDVI